MRRVDQQRRVDQKDFHDGRRLAFVSDQIRAGLRDLIAEVERSLRRSADVQDVRPKGIFRVRFSFACFDEATNTKFKNNIWTSEKKTGSRETSQQRWNFFCSFSTSPLLRPM